MHRRRFLSLCGVSASITAAGCVQPPMNGESPTTEIPVSIVTTTAQPDVPFEYDAEMIESVANDERPARLRITITNSSDEVIALGEERDVQFHHVSSIERSLYLHPAGGETWDGPVDPGCWQMTEYVPIPEYYGVVTVESGEVLQAESYVYGHPELPDEVCLPEGEHHLDTSGVVGSDETAVLEGTSVTEFKWGVTLRVGE